MTDTQRELLRAIEFRIRDFGRAVRDVADGQKPEHEADHAYAVAVTALIRFAEAMEKKR